MSKQNEKDFFGKEEGNYIDKIIKENCKNMIPLIFEKICGLQWSKMKPLPDIKQQVTREKEPDFLQMIYNDDYPRGAVVHVEFETTDNSKMCRRMLEYTGMLHFNTNKPVLQYVVYLGKGKARMKHRAKWDGLEFSFPVINIEDYSYRDFLNSEYPEGVILSLIANHDGIDVTELTELIIGRLVLNKENKIANGKFINQLIMFARLRNLHRPVTNKLIRMKETTFFDVNTDILYMKGIEKGIERGIERGIEKGMEKGEKKGLIKQQIVTILKGIRLELKDDLITEMANAVPGFVKSIRTDYAKKSKIVTELKKRNSDPKVIAEKFKVHPLLVEIFQDEMKKQN